MSWKTWLGLTSLFALVMWMAWPTGTSTLAVNSRTAVGSVAQPINPPIEEVAFIVSEPVVPELSAAVRDLPPLDLSQQDPTLNREINPRSNPALLWHTPSGESNDFTPDSLIAHGIYGAGTTPATDFTFEGVDNLGGCGGCPPDTVGEIGPNHYIQMVNATKVAIYTRATTPPTLATPLFNLGSLWTSGNCASNAGDPIVVYDELADRWLLSQFADPNHMCIAISQTADPTAAYYIYTFNVLSFPDYFKFGVWPDGYYMSANEGSYTAYAFDRDKMLNGQAATFQQFTGQTNLLLPSDIDGTTPPPVGSPNYFYTYKDNSAHGGNDRLEIFAFDVDWVTPSNTTFALIQTINIAPFTYTVCGFFNFNCAQQPGTSQRLDTVSEWPMFRFPYRNFGTHETLLGTFTVRAAPAEQRGVIRWFELRKTGAGWTLYQEGTFDPNDGHGRYMPSIAMDKEGNIALGYSASSTTLHPSIRYTTRLASDPLGTMRPEQTLQAGSGSQTGGNRWGDYSTMSIDPTNGCTFWYTNQYYPTTASTTWKTRIGAFTIPECLLGTSAIELTQTVGNTPTSCALTDELTLPPNGGQATYCYRVTNTGTTTLTHHTVVDDQWGTLLDNIALALGPNDTTFITVTVNVTQTTTNVGTWTASSSVSVTASAVASTTVTVPPFVYDVALGPDQAGSGLPSNTVTYTIPITNGGNVADTYALALAGSNWLTELAETEITLAGQEMGWVTVTVAIPAGEMFGTTDVVTVTATSQGNNSVGDSAVLTTGVGLVYGVELSSDPEVQTVEAGTVVTYTLTLTNTGNLTDTFSIGVAGHNWTTAISHTPLIVPAGESAEFTLMVTVPLTATYPASDTVAVTAVSNGNSIFTTQLSLTTSVLRVGYEIYLPLITR